MNRKELKAFIESPTGAGLMESINDMIHLLHEESEKNPDTARDNAQQAAGMRKIENLIKSMVAGRKKQK